MFIYPDIDERRSFMWRDIHKKIGQIIVIEPTDSCIQEGDTLTKIYMVDEKRVWWLLREFYAPVPSPKPTPPDERKG